MELRTYLYVPSDEKDTAEAQGAQWDSRARRWYVPERMDSELFHAWLPLWEEEDRLHINGPLFVVEAKTTCKICQERIPVLALATELLDHNGEPYICTFLQVEEVPADVASLLESAYPFFKKDFSIAAESRCLLNHCPCGAVLDDWDLHEEPGGSFYPISIEEAMATVLRCIPRVGRLILKASYSDPPDDLIGLYASRRSF